MREAKGFNVMWNRKPQSQLSRQSLFSFKDSRVRNALRKVLFQFVQKISETDDARSLWSSTLRSQLAWQPHLSLKDYIDATPPYAGLGKSRYDTQPAQRKDVIIITGRFRSGSTLFWNLFRNIDGITAYYEPFNERRWFDPQMHGDKTDPTHRKVTNYWQEYEGLGVLGKYYCEEWVEKNLYMGAAFWAPKMKRYVELMIEKAPGRPVLQFNRIDFRLPWFRQNFPNAQILHIYRHPRDQWCSALMDPQSFPKDGAMNRFAPYDKFYLRAWAKDLRYHFPFLDESSISHPYQMFYYIWKISYVFGSAFSHYSIAFEEVLEDPDGQLNNLFKSLHIRQYDMGKLKSLIERPPLGKWKNYATDEWFRYHETICEMTLADFFANISVDQVIEECAKNPAVELDREENPCLIQRKVYRN
jgi:hypothetical protein